MSSLPAFLDRVGFAGGHDLTLCPQARRITAPRSKT
jgi:hypothetical protein